ncbi:homoserine kinase [Pleionea litopenaei]|uniref:Homoserine kinase n=1 Tax=Pleionea litopenaei TaxID=3070815 RepID=A0AA51RSQ7_9GAMM|nr:homoserine kinase [Pleionea sp. HL-JVS1]WMS86895.1 homoserine kinase [Pleionea sp. HL-JVS1]
MPSITVFAPASIGNFIVGFDVLGAAIKTDDRLLGDTLTISDDKPAGYSAEGEFAFRLPQDKDNLVIKTASFFNQQLALLQPDIKAQKLTFKLSKNLPIGSGLGSSSSSIVATLYGLNQWYQSPFSQDQLLLWSAKIEGGNAGAEHYDNVAPCLLGGLQLINEEALPVCRRLPFFNNLYFAFCFPDIEITTRKAREVLPKTLTLQQAINMQKRLATFTAACFEHDQSSAIQSLLDDSIQPSRQSLIPNFDQAHQLALNNGALAFAISGSGPTCFAVCPSQEIAQTLAPRLQKTLQQGPHSFHWVSQIDELGARLL